ncbi:hypothetical protein ACTXT7_006873 [Hymenolepis weldensis]
MPGTLLTNLDILSQQSVHNALSLPCGAQLITIAFIQQLLSNFASERCGYLQLLLPYQQGVVLLTHQFESSTRVLNA